MMAHPFDRRPSDFILPDNVRRMLGLQSMTILQRLLSTEAVRDEIDRILLNRLGRLPEFDAEAEDIQRFLCRAEPDEIRRLARILAVLSQSAAARVSLHGPTLAAYNEVCPGGKIVSFMRRTILPTCAALPPLRTASTEALELCSQLAERLLFGLLPEGLLVRIASRRSTENFPMPLSLPDEAARDAFLTLARAALTYLDQHGDEDAADQTS
jgi:hypothetical protein